MDTGIDPIAMLDALTTCAYQLAMDLGEAARTETDLTRQLDRVEAFNDCCRAVRLSIALKLRLAAEARAAALAPRRREIEAESYAESDAETEIETPERPERPRVHPEREREREAVSLPILLRTVERIVDRAEAAGLEPAPAELPALAELLDRLRTLPDAKRPSPSKGSAPKPRAPAEAHLPPTPS